MAGALAVAGADDGGRKLAVVAAGVQIVDADMRTPLPFGIEL